MTVDMLYRKMTTAWHMPLSEKCGFIGLFLYSGIIRLAILTLPYRYWAGVLGRHYERTELSVIASEHQQSTARRLGRLCALVSQYTPWETLCLVQAIMLTTCLTIHRIPYVVHLGVLPTGSATQPLKAHAWVKVGAVCVAGSAGHETFGVIATYVAPTVLCLQKESP